ncbi:MAG TPA: hypothetical protein VHF89_10925 [Solirubrobacteraceae bacterium]|nr:hypothetical protein [Solirubrobacteraceae bacterium]
MTNPSGPARSVKIGDDERGGWSSDRPRRGKGPDRPADVSTRCRVLAPADRLRYSPGSLVVVVSGSEEEADRLAQRVFEERGAVLTSVKVRGLLAGKVPDEELADKASALLAAAAAKRLQAGDSTVVAGKLLDPAEREPFVRLAATLRRPRHAILVEAAREQTDDEDRPALNELRRALDAGELGAEGFQTALRLGGGAAAELKRIVFRPPPRDDE